MSKKLEVLEERVLEVAKTCPQVEKALKGLFPEAFKTTVTWEPGDTFTYGGSGGRDKFVYLKKIPGGNYHKVMRLSDSYSAKKGTIESFLLTDNPGPVKFNV